MHRSLFLIRTKHLFGVIIAKCWHVKYWIDIELFDSYVGTWLTLSHMWHISWMLEFRPCDLHSLSGLLSSLSFCNLVSPWMKQRYWWKEVKIQRTIENATFFQFSTAGNIIDVNNKHFTKYVHQSKNLNFVPTIKIFNRKLHYINRKL